MVFEKENNTAVIFKEKRTSQILQSNNENKTNWKQSMITGEYLEASFIVIIFRQHGHVENCASECRVGLFQDCFAGDLNDSKSTSGRMLCTSGSQTFVLTSWSCNKQAAVSQRHGGRNYLISRWSKIGRNSCAQCMGRGIRYVRASSGSDPMHNINGQKTKPLMADKRVTDSIDDVPSNSHTSSQKSVFVCF